MRGASGGTRDASFQFDQPSAGQIKMEVLDGYPVMCRLYHNGNLIGSFHHRELSDLSYVISRTKEAAREKLGSEHFREV